MTLFLEPPFMYFLLLMAALFSLVTTAAAPEAKGTATGVTLFFIVLFLACWYASGLQ